MIVKNEEKYLKDCLASVKDVVDEIVIIDTGSTDNTLKIAENFNAKIFYYKWNNDFSSARNYALENSKGDWILYLDADERLSAESIKKLKELTLVQKEVAYYCTIQNIDKIGNRPSIMKYVRLFPNNKKIRFVGKIHEQIEESLIQNGFTISDSEIEIIHLGYSLMEDSIIVKAKRNLEILLNEFEINPSSYYAFHLGQTYGILNSSEQAIYHFQKALEDSYLKGEYRSVALRFLAVKSAEQHNWLEAKEYISKSLNSNYEQPVNLMVAAKIHFHLKDYQTAIKLCKDAYEINSSFFIGKKKSYQAILLSEETILYEGLNISLHSKDKEAFSYFYKKFNMKEDIRNKNILGLLNILINKESLSSFKKYISEVNNENIELILTLIEEYSLKERIDTYKSLSPFFKVNSLFLLKYGLVLANDKKYDEAEKKLEKSFELSRNPSIVFYLISTYLQNSKPAKVIEILSVAENAFSGKKEIIERLSILKDKLSAHLTAS